MFKHILLPIKLNGREGFASALDVADELASRGDAVLTLGTIIPHWVANRDADWSWDAKNQFVEAAETGLRRIVEQARCERCTTLVHWGSVPSSILDMGEEVGADLIVLPAREPGLRDLLRTPEALRIAGRAHCSVLLVRD